MKTFLLSVLFTIFFLPTFLFAQEEPSSIFALPHELNEAAWLNRFPHSFIPLTIDYEPSESSGFSNYNISNNTLPQNEPSVKISRKDPNRVVAAWRDFRTGVNPALRRVGYSYSTDGGETWSVSQLTPQIIPNVPLSSDPVVGVDTSGNFYIYTISLNGTSGNGELWLFKSTDGGENFDQVYQLASSSDFEDKEWATADLNPASPFANRLYCSWTRFGFSTDILLVRSTDEGVTWSAPVTVSDQTSVQGSFPEVSTTGDLYITWAGFNSAEQIMFDKSTDGGVTFGNDVVVSNAPNSWFPHMAVDHSGSPFNDYIYVVWNDERNGDGDIFMSRSSNGGGGWSPALRINNDPIANNKEQYWPSIAISELGEIVILFYDTRNTANNNIIEAYLARSTDGGATFTNELLSTAQSTTNIPNGDVRFGDYINIDAYGGNIVPVWTDERAGGFDMDIYTAFVEPIVPVELINFTADVTNGKITLSWTTATELNNQGFEIQRSTDNNIFNTIGFVKGNGTTTQNHDYNFVDEYINGKVYYRLKQVDYNGSYNYSNVIEATGISISQMELEQNYPNPFNPATTINYKLSNDGYVSLKIFNSLGEEVTKLVNEFQKAGNHKIVFDGKELPSGMYVYKLTSGNYTESKKMLLLK